LCATVAFPVRAEFKCDGRQLARVDATACAYATKGPDSLRRFVTRTQKIYGLQMSDYVRFVGDERHAPPARTAQATPQTSIAGVARPSH
jgi:hypothetical protein